MLKLGLNFSAALVNRVSYSIHPKVDCAFVTDSAKSGLIADAWKSTT